MSFNINDVEWDEFEKGNATGIQAKDLDPLGSLPNLSIKMMKINPGGEFPPHSDPYSHHFYLISGTGEGQLGETVYRMERGHVLIVKAGEKHGYRNIGPDAMYLLTLNIY